jgi:hypothetical protein
MMEEMVKMVYLDLKDLRERTGKMAETVAMVMMGKMGLQGHPDRQEEMELPELKEIPASRVRKVHLGKTAPREIRASQDPSDLLASKETKVHQVLPAFRVRGDLGDRPVEAVITMMNQDSNFPENVQSTATAPVRLIRRSGGLIASTALRARALALALKVTAGVEGRRSIAKAENQVHQVHQVLKAHPVPKARRAMTGPDAVTDHTTKMDANTGLEVAIITTLIVLLKAMKGTMEVENGCIDTNANRPLPLAIPTIIERRSPKKEEKARAMTTLMLRRSITPFMTAC